MKQVSKKNGETKTGDDKQTEGNMLCGAEGENRVKSNRITTKDRGGKKEYDGAQRYWRGNGF